MLQLLTGVLLVVMTTSRTAWAQATYTWNVNGTGAWVTATNWSPTRTTPAATDILRIDGVTTPSVTINTIINQSIGQLVVANGATVRLQPSHQTRPPS